MGIGSTTLLRCARRCASRYWARGVQITHPTAFGRHRETYS